MKKSLLNALCILFCIIFVFSSAVSVNAAGVKYSGSSSYRDSIYYKKLKSVKLTGNNAVDVVNVALSQVGYHESDSSYDLSGESSGCSSCTEYGDWYGNQTDWCNIFVSWCGFVAGVSADIFPKLPSCSNSYYSVLPSAGAKCFEFTSGEELKPGDLFFSCTCSGSHGCIDHMGIIEKVDGDYIYTVEGNLTDRVQRVKYPVSSGYSSDKNAQINYIARPAYRNLKNDAKKAELKKLLKTLKPVNTASFGGYKYEIYDAETSYYVAKSFAKAKKGLLVCELSAAEKQLLPLILKSSKGYFIENGVILNSKKYADVSLKKYGKNKKAGFIVKYKESENVVISYNSNGGENTPCEQICKKKEKISLTSVIPVKENCKFLGWALSENAKMPDYTAKSKVMFKKDTVLFAVWQKN